MHIWVLSKAAPPSNPRAAFEDAVRQTDAALRGLPSGKVKVGGTRRTRRPKRPRGMGEEEMEDTLAPSIRESLEAQGTLAPKKPKAGRRLILTRRGGV